MKPLLTILLLVIPTMASAQCLNCGKFHPGMVTKIEAVQSAPATFSVESYAVQWNQPRQLSTTRSARERELIRHLTQDHGYSNASVASLSYNQLEALHTAAHNREARTRVQFRPAANHGFFFRR